MASQAQTSYQQAAQPTLNLSMAQPLQPVPQQPPTPGGQPTQMPYAVINAPPPQQFTVAQQQLGEREQFFESHEAVCALEMWTRVL